MIENIALITGIIGTTTGVSGLILSILNYFRDKPNIQIIPKWDMEGFNLPSQYDQTKMWGVISIINVGRRPIFISHVSLKTHIKNRYILINEGISGEKLLEGDPPKRYIVKQEGLQEYAESWKEVRAIVYDSRAKEYISKPVKEKPSWAEN